MPNKIELINVMEYVVRNMVEEVLKQEGACTCEHCKMDAMAIALNNLAPKYVVTDQGKAYETFRASGPTQSRIGVYQAVLKAAHVVKQGPRHGDGRRFEE